MACKPHKRTKRLEFRLQLHLKKTSVLCIHVCVCLRVCVCVCVFSCRYLTCFYLMGFGCTHANWLMRKSPDVGVYLCVCLCVCVCICVYVCMCVCVWLFNFLWNGALSW